MTHLGSISGTGRLILDGKDLGAAEYEIDVSQPRFIPEARGIISSEEATIFDLVGKKLVLKLESGESIDIIVNSSNGGIVVSGPVPGFQPRR